MTLAERRRRVLILYLAGLSYAQIGEELPISHATARADALALGVTSRPPSKRRRYGPDVERVCEQCGGTFVARARQVAAGEGRFCSVSCVAAHGHQTGRLTGRPNKQVTAPCSRCGTPVTRPPSLMLTLVYCSDCSFRDDPAWQAFVQERRWPNGKSVTGCDGCGEDFPRPPHLLRDRNFCAECWAKRGYQLVLLECSACGRDVWRRPHDMRGLRTYCGHCATHAPWVEIGERISLSCLHCGRTHSRKPNESYMRFCSYECWGKYRWEKGVGGIEKLLALRGGPRARQRWHGRWNGHKGAAAGIEAGRAKGGRPSAATPAQQQQMLKLHRDGRSTREIAEAVFGDARYKDRVARFLRR